MGGPYENTTVYCQRRSFLLKGSLVLLVIPLVDLTPARATKMSKADFYYQDHPRDGKKCVNCLSYLPQGQCRLVEGEISPDGWCTLYTQK